MIIVLRKPASTLPKSSNRFSPKLSIPTVTNLSNYNKYLYANLSIYCRYNSARIITNIYMQIFPFTADIILPEL
jgi:hypothetical protein